MAIRYWLVVQPLDRAQLMMAHGFVQVPWGPREPLEQLNESDGVVLYSPRETNPDGETLRAVVGAGRVLPGEPYQAGGRGASPWRREVEWLPEPRIAPIRPLKDMLDLTRDNRYWGEQLRDGILEITPRDFTVFEDSVRRRAPEPGTLGAVLRGRHTATEPSGLLRETGWPLGTSSDAKLLDEF